MSDELKPRGVSMTDKAYNEYADAAKKENKTFSAFVRDAITFYLNDKTGSVEWFNNSKRYNFMRRQKRITVMVDGTPYKGLSLDSVIDRAMQVWRDK